MDALFIEWEDGVHIVEYSPPNFENSKLTRHFKQYGEYHHQPQMQNNTTFTADDLTKPCYVLLPTLNRATNLSRRRKTKSKSNQGKPTKKKRCFRCVNCLVHDCLVRTISVCCAWCVQCYGIRFILNQPGIFRY